MEELDEFFGTGKTGVKAGRVVQLSGRATDAMRERLIDALSSSASASASTSGFEHEPLGTAYAYEAEAHEKWREVVEAEDEFVRMDVDEMETFDDFEEPEDDYDEAFDKYRLNVDRKRSYMIDDYKSEILNSVKSNTVTIIEGPTGCGKTTQVPLWLLENAHRNKTYCKIVTTQPRRIAALSVTNHVCKESNSKVGDLIGYQIGLDKKMSPDTRLSFVTTGVLLQSLVRTKSLSNYSYIILDEVHEREKDMDFLLIIIKKLIKHKNNKTKLILMSATFNVSMFYDYFYDSFKENLSTIPIITVKEKQSFPRKIFYLENLSKIGKIPALTKDQPMIVNESFELCLKLLCAFEDMDVIEEAKSEVKRPCILIFLPGFFEIEELYLILSDNVKRKKIVPNAPLHKWFIVPLHSTITADEQRKAFMTPPNDYRKIILATNIAESSITVPDTKYVIDFCLTKMVVCNPSSGFSSLKLYWASKNNCIQRAGRAGRTQIGRVYRLISQDFYNELDQESIPEMKRTSLEHLVLNTKLLDFGSPKNILGLAMDPPDLSNINKTVLILKEIGGLYNNVDEDYVPDDGELTFIGKMMASLPLDVRVSKLILFGYMFGVLEDSIIIAAAISGKSIFSSPFRNRMSAFNSKLTWSFGSTSDCIAFLNVYKVYSTHKKNKIFSTYNRGLKGWADEMFLQERALIELDKLIEEIKERLKHVGIYVNVEEKGIWSRLEKPLILKMVMAGAFYPNYFVLQSRDDEREYVKILNGKDPTNTVYLTNMDNHQPGLLYTSAMKSIFRSLLSTEVDVEFDSGSRKIIVSCQNNSSSPEHLLDAKIPGKTALFVYQAVKMRLLRIPISIDVMPTEKALQLYKEYENFVSQKSQPNRCDSFSLDALSPFLPSLDETFLRITISHMQNCYTFWANNHDQYTIDSLNFVNHVLNKSNSGLLALDGIPLIGRIYAALYKDSDESQALYYRARVINIIDNDSVYVQFVDYGNSCNISNKDLKVLNPKEKNVFKIPPLAYECALEGIAPSVLKDSKGSWTNEANARFRDLTLKKKLHGKVYSVVQSVVHLELLVNNISVNDILIKEGFAQKSEESYASKFNKDLRDRVSNMQLSQIKAFSKEQEKENKSMYINYFTPNPDECTRKIILKGPFSPLEAKVYSVLSTGKNKSATVEWDSVNSVLLNTDHHDRTERLLVSATVNESKDGGDLKLRNTTLLPNIPGLTELITLIFCPTAELCSNPNNDRYVGILCGLGHINGRSIFPEHDIFININADITNDDIDKINFLRSTMNFILKSSNGEKGLNINHIERAKKLNVIKAIIEKLLSIHRKQYEVSTVMDTWNWNKPGRRLVSDSEPEGQNIFPPHSKLQLNSKQPELLEFLAKENAKIYEICQGLYHSDKKEYTCKLCDTEPLSIPSLRLHLQSRIHKDHEADLPIMS